MRDRPVTETDYLVTGAGATADAAKMALLKASGAAAAAAGLAGTGPLTGFRRP